MIERLISGGQTGVDRAALDVARELGLACGGWCPKGRLAEDGVIPAHYALEETPSAKYRQRTKWNVRDSDGTLVLTKGRPTGGTALTVEVAARLNKPCLILDLSRCPQPSEVQDWASRHQIKVLNVAGPRESTAPGIYKEAAAFLRQVLSTRAPRAPGD